MLLSVIIGFVGVNNNLTNMDLKLSLDLLEDGYMLKEGYFFESQKHIWTIRFAVVNFYRI